MVGGVLSLLGATAVIACIVFMATHPDLALQD